MTNAEHRHLRLLLAHYREVDDPASVTMRAPSGRSRGPSS